jgi:hypothetical protein
VRLIEQEPPRTASDLSQQIRRGRESDLTSPSAEENLKPAAIHDRTGLARKVRILSRGR